jgi:DNA-binding transcriptional LysR family regulator
VKNREQVAVLPVAVGAPFQAEHRAPVLAEPNQKQAAPRRLVTREHRAEVRRGTPAEAETRGWPDTEVRAVVSELAERSARAARGGAAAGVVPAELAEAVVRAARQEQVVPMTAVDRVG